MVNIPFSILPGHIKDNSGRPEIHNYDCQLNKVLKAWFEPTPVNQSIQAGELRARL